MKIVNIDRLNCLPGGVAQEWDRAVVISETLTEPHPITGKLQPKCLFRGTLKAAHEFVLSHV
jgi:hypothetical protein